MNHELKISLAPSGKINVHFPSGRKLGVSPTEAGARFIVEMLRGANAGERDKPAHIGLFPTEHVLNTWMKQDRTRTQEEAKERTAETASALNVDLDALDISL